MTINKTPRFPLTPQNNKDFALNAFLDERDRKRKKLIEFLNGREPNVTIKHDPARDKEYDLEAREMRALHDGMKGAITAYHTAHGQCVTVEFGDGSAYYDVEEIVWP